MNLYHLISELAIDVIAVILGIILFIRKTDNLPKFYWGIIAFLIGSVFIWENIGWLIVRNQDPVYEYTELLNIEKMLKYYLLASFVALFPLASLRPGYLNKFRLILFLLPPVIIVTVGISFLCFNGNITPLDSFGQVINSTDKLDVRLRLVIFLFSVFNPLFYFVFPLLKNSCPQRKINPMMYLFFGFMFVLFGIYILFTLSVNHVWFNGFGFVSITFSIIFSIQYLRVENPLSDYVGIKNKQVMDGTREELKKEPVCPTVLPLYYEIDNYLKQTCVYAQSDYTLERLAGHFGAKSITVSTAIKSGGYSGFREYINQLRLEYFKHQVSLNPHRTVKELMFSCGFTSRPTFYRAFAQRYCITPTEYIENQLK